jgi:HD-like signal output (HDOD) protein
MATHGECAVKSESYEVLLKDLAIPPRPEVVTILFAEIRKEHPDLKRVTAALIKDPALSAGMLRAANSPYFGLNRKVSSVPKAISVLGLTHVSNIVTGLAIRHALKGGDSAPSFDKFWQNAEQISMLCHYVARRLRGISADDAYTYGLFRDCGVPVLIQHFPHYRETLKRANDSRWMGTTQVEESETGTSHSILGYFLARAWLLPDHISRAILLHHDIEAFADPATSNEARNLIGVGFLAEHIQQSWLGNLDDAEWTKAAPSVTKHFALDDEDISDLGDSARAAIFGDH